jgi:hypothetical protein
MNYPADFAASRSVRIPRRKSDRLKTALPFLIALLLAGIVLIAGMAIGEEDSFLRQHSTGVTLCIGCGLVFLLPSLYLKSRQRFDFFHPLVYPVFTYLFPAFTLGGLYLMGGYISPWVMDLVSDPDYHLSLSFVYILIGFIGLIVGFMLPLGGVGGKVLSRRMPRWIWNEKEVLGPGFLLLLIGMGMSFWAIAVGMGGYQIRETVAVESGFAYSLTIIGNLGSFLLWWAYFKRKKKNFLMHLLLATLIVQIFLSGLVSGSRATILVAAIGIFAAYRFAGRRIRRRTIILFGIIGVLSLIIGFNLGSTYREIKGSEDSVSAGESLKYGINSVEQLIKRDVLDNVYDSIDLFLGRLESVSSLTVIVANYERLLPLEEQYGIKNSIWTSTWTALIPRLLWPDKPIISNARAVAALYFNFPANSFGFTIFGDLLRNFGPFGVPAGMVVLGIMLRILYVAFLENGSGSIWRVASYFLLLSSVNYEAFYGTILPNFIRLGFVLMIGGFLVHILIVYNRRYRGIKIVVYPKAVSSKIVPV